MWCSSFSMQDSKQQPKPNTELPPLRMNIDNYITLKSAVQYDHPIPSVDFFTTPVWYDQIPQQTCCVSSLDGQHLQSTPKQNTWRNTPCKQVDACLTYTLKSAHLKPQGIQTNLVDVMIAGDYIYSAQWLRTWIMWSMGNHQEKKHHFLESKLAKGCQTRSHRQNCRWCWTGLIGGVTLW